MEPYKEILLTFIQIYRTTNCCFRALIVLVRLSFFQKSVKILKFRSFYSELDMSACRDLKKKHFKNGVFWHGKSYWEIKVVLIMSFNIRVCSKLENIMKKLAELCTICDVVNILLSFYIPFISKTLPNTIIAE